MKRKNTTRSTLVTSVISLLLCVSMLVGATFAWFTDSVESGRNTIAAGNLDVELYHSDKVDKNAKVTEATILFDDVELWEPGAVTYEALTIVNEGSLALQYGLAIQFANANGVLFEDEVYTLADVLKVAVVPAEKLTSREAAIAAGNEAGWKELISWAENGKLYPETGKDTDTYGIVIYWEPTANDNIWNLNNGKLTTDGADQLVIDLGVYLTATQLPYEEDSFDEFYDKDASITVTEDGELTLAQAIAQVKDGGIVFVETGVYNLSSQVTIDGKSLSIIGLGDVTITTSAKQHMFTIQDQFDPNSDAVINLVNLTLDGKGVSKHGINVKYNVTVNMEDVTVKNTGWAGVLLDNANKYNDGKFYANTATRVAMDNCDICSVSLDALPVVDTHSNANAGVTTYVYLNYDLCTKIGALEIQEINALNENIFINGVAAENIGETMNLYVKNDAELAAALALIKSNDEYWNKQVYVYLAAGVYSGNHQINQYPQWNGTIGAGNTDNNYASGVPAGAPNTIITFVGETAATFGARAQAVPSVIFTGNVKVLGFGNSNAGLGSATAVTAFQNIAFDAANSADEEKPEDAVIMYVQAAASNVYFEGCTFVNATHITLGGSNPNIVGNIAFTECVFNNGGCLSGNYKNLKITKCFVNKADNGFLNQQNAGVITITDSQIEAGRYFIRTNGSGVELTVENSNISIYESEGTKHLVYFRGSNESAEFTDCTIVDGWTSTGVDANSTLEVINFYNVDGVTYYKDGVTGERVLHLVPQDYTGKTVNVVEGTTKIGNYAFAYNNNVKEVILASTIRDLGRAFDSSTVEKVVLNEGLTIIGSRAFKSATALKEVVIPSTVTEIADNAFQKSGIKEIIIPASVKTVGETAFGSSLIEKVTFEGDIAIQGYAFRGCTKLNTVIMNGYDVSFVKSALNGRNSMWFCNGESNNPNTSNITFYVKNDVIKERVLTAMGAERNNTPVVCEQTAVAGETGTYYTDGNGNAYAYDGNALRDALNGDVVGDVIFATDVITNDAESNAYGATGLNIKNGETLDGNGKTLKVTGADATWDSAINITGGTIKNLTVAQGFRGIFVNHNGTGGKVVLENVTIEGPTYTISCDQGTGNGLEATGCTINGWTSYAATIGEVKFVDCSFGKGAGYAFCRPYAATEFVGCDFAAGYEIDARAAVSFENCTINGVALTAENLATLVTGNISNATVK